MMSNHVMPAAKSYIDAEPRSRAPILARSERLPRQKMTDKIACTLIDLLATEGDLTTAARILAPEEAARAARIVRGPQRRRYMIARSSLRVLLAQTFGIEVRAVPLANDDFGKPILTGDLHGRLGFNLSHSGDLALIAIGPQLAIGVDIEPIARPRLGVAEKYFSSAENEALGTLSGAALAAGFTRLWTRKEAVAKAVGLGLRLPLDKFDAPLEQAACTHLTGCRFDPTLVQRLALLDCPAPVGWSACVAVIDSPAKPVLAVSQVLPLARLLS